MMCCDQCRYLAMDCVFSGRSEGVHEKPQRSKRDAATRAAVVRLRLVQVCSHCSRLSHLIHLIQLLLLFNSTRGRMNGSGDINSLGLLPDKLKTELALHVNLETLKKVGVGIDCHKRKVRQNDASCSYCCVIQSRQVLIYKTRTCT